MQYIDLINQGGDGTSRTLHNLTATKFRAHKNATGIETIAWARGNITVFDRDEVKIGEASYNQSNPTQFREPSFEAYEYARILHALSDTRMLTDRQLPMEPRTPHELDGEPIDVWSEHSAPLFNYNNFKPDVVTVSIGSMSHSEISAIDKRKQPFKREDVWLKRKSAAFRSE